MHMYTLVYMHVPIVDAPMYKYKEAVQIIQICIRCSGGLHKEAEFEAEKSGIWHLGARGAAPTL